MTDLWADYSFARPAVADLKRAGVVGLFRYLAPLPNKKVLSAAERDLLLAAGFDLVLNWEWYEGRCNEGATAGRVDAVEAARQAKALNYPTGAAIYFSHDTGTYNWQAIKAYFASAKEVCHTAGYKIGCYGSYELVRTLRSEMLVDYTWQTLAWSQRQRDPLSEIYQRGTATVPGTDDNEVTSADIGSWLQQGSKEDMALSDDDKAWITGALQHVLDDLTGTKNRIKDQITPGVADLQAKLKSLQADVAKLTPAATGGAGVDAKTFVDELGRRLVPAQ